MSGYRSAPVVAQHGSQCQERLPGAPWLLPAQETGQRSAHLPAGTGECRPREHVSAAFTGRTGVHTLPLYCKCSADTPAALRLCCSLVCHHFDRSTKTSSVPKIETKTVIPPSLLIIMQGWRAGMMQLLHLWPDHTHKGKWNIESLKFEVHMCGFCIVFGFILIHLSIKINNHHCQKAA